MIDTTPYTCKHCNSKHGMYLYNSINDTSTPLDLCNKCCMFASPVLYTKLDLQHIFQNDMEIEDSLTLKDDILL